MSLLQPREVAAEDLALPAQANQEIGHAVRLRGHGCLTLSRRQAAERIGISERALDRLLVAGLLHYVRGTKRLSQARVDALCHG